MAESIGTLVFLGQATVVVVVVLCLLGIALWYVTRPTDKD